MLKKTWSSNGNISLSAPAVKKITKGEAFQKACNYCVYQERTQQEARDKLYELGLSSDDVEDLLTKLILENFVNEERFAKTFSGGKFRIKKWGRNKILRELKIKGLSDYCIKKGLSEIKENDYQEVLKDLIIEKASSVREVDQYKKRHKIGSFLINKGYESDLVWDMIKKLV